MPPPSSRMTKNQAQPARYRPGKAEVEDVESEEESSEEEDDAPKAPPPKATSFPSQKKLAVDLTRAGQQNSTAPKHNVQKTDDDLEGFVTASESEEEEDGESDEEDEDEESSEEEESSSDEDSRKPMLRPTFISKAKRAQLATTSGKSTEDKAAEEERLRKEKADELLQAQLERDAAARAAGKKAWDDDAEIAPEDEVDDTDDVDPEAEKAAWKLRELKRVRRDRLAIEEKEKELEEIERRRNLTAEEREAEDREYIAAQEEEREGKGKIKFMQKYHHKGAFFQGDDEQDEEVKAALNRDFAGARFEDETGDKSVLPEYMRIRDMTKLGKKGRTKYKDMRNEDTGRWGEFGRKQRDYDGLDDRFKPDDPRDAGSDRTGANTAPVGERRRRESDGSRDREDKRARYD
ncbi:Hypothetical protein R9X50_00495300 [Acrodontium crateriforme]|uniref:Micro-fibrillar-associated protein 1 C-terminal domain-containing protein n=1 Tax=Acrodontium crateriforme TaxID=150365 RepID=A0AAQ3RD10_9PEZI|nr:Hypothetical protein R9X50_00495300 [Acrodontium crateriforme]